MDIVEFFRMKSVQSLFDMPRFKSTFSKWKPIIEKTLGGRVNYRGILFLGDKLSSIFRSTAGGGRTQSELSAGGAAWEGLVCWYLNLGLIGSRTVVMKNSKRFVPSSILNALTVNYGSSASNSESDLVSITFPNEADFSRDLNTFNVTIKHRPIDILDELCQKYFKSLSVGIISCKTGWNDDAQIPMLWQIVYSSVGFSNERISIGGSNITIGRDGFSIRDLARFFYSFVTVPSGKKQLSYKSSAMPVVRVRNLSGGNFWGRQSISGIADSIKEFFARNLSAGWRLSTHKADVDGALEHKQDFMYFNISI